MGEEKAGGLFIEKPRNDVSATYNEIERNTNNYILKYWSEESQSMTK